MSADISSYMRFSKHLQEAHTSLDLLGNKLPKKGVTAFKIDNKGNFTLTYDAAYEGTFSHYDTEKQKKFADFSIKVAKQVVGKITPSTKTVPGKVDFTSGITVTKHNRGRRFYPAVTVSLTSAQAVAAESANLLMTASIFGVRKGDEISEEMLLSTKIDWKKA